MNCYTRRVIVTDGDKKYTGVVEIWAINESEAEDYFANLPLWGVAIDVDLPPSFTNEKTRSAMVLGIPRSAIQWEGAET